MFNQAEPNKKEKKRKEEKVSFICDRTLNTIDKRLVSTVIIDRRIIINEEKKKKIRRSAGKKTNSAKSRG